MATTLAALALVATPALASPAVDQYTETLPGGGGQKTTNEIGEQISEGSADDPAGSPGTFEALVPAGAQGAIPAALAAAAEATAPDSLRDEDAGRGGPSDRGSGDEDGRPEAEVASLAGSEEGSAGLGVLLPIFLAITLLLSLGVRFTTRKRIDR